jgi:tetratricopeptide (TPR) repeat protein
MKKFALILLTLVLMVPAFAQGRFGKDSAECTKYLSYYKELYKQKNMAEASPFWRQAFSLCPPTASQNMLIDGQAIMRYDINQNKKNPARVKELVDTLLMLHDIRAQYFPKYAVKSMDNKAIDVINYCASDNELQYKVLTEVLNNIQGNASPVVFVNQMKSCVEMYRKEKISPEDVMNNYTTISGYLDAKIDSSNDPQYRGAKQDVESLLIDSGVASCDNLVALYTPRFEANPTDEALLTNMVKMMSKSECMNTELFLKAIVALNEINPTASSVYGLYKLYSSRDENTKAAETLERAISLLNPEDVATKADYTFELATYYFKKCGKAAPAVAKAKEVVEMDESYKGKAYLLIGTIWGGQKCGGDEVSSRANFWVAVDYLQRAAAADPAVAEDANSMAAQYRRYFPKTEDAFFLDITEGSGYTVSCGGMSEHTTVRTNK